MIELVPWSDRQFKFDHSVATFPLVLERLRGTPARAAELVKGVSEHALSIRVREKWSIKERTSAILGITKSWRRSDWQGFWHESLKCQQRIRELRSKES